MSVGVILLTHGHIGRSILEVCNFIYGSVPLTIEDISVTADDTPETIESKLETSFAKTNSPDGVIILTDIFGATPFNIANRIITGEKVKILTGINLQMLLKIFNFNDLDIEELSEKICNAGKNSIEILQTGIEL
ncbi:MAG: PTS sugar transporter subunit IIA [Gammaproteobacteria bacterium]|mgnify:CR=1 FL=1|nr:MAG: PTS sugar transporter subunit IIA [Gammaproteobacteria bacterium]